MAHVVWCDAGGMTNRQQPWAHRQGQRETARTSKSKQKEVHLKSGQSNCNVFIRPTDISCFLGGLPCLLLDGDDDDDDDDIVAYTYRTYRTYRKREGRQQ